VLQQARYHLNHDTAEQLSSQQNTDSYTFQSRPTELNFQKSHDYSNRTWLNCLKLSCCFGVQGGSDGGVARTAGHYVIHGKLEEQLAVITKRKTRKRKRLQHGSTLEYGTAAARGAAEASAAPQRSKKARGSSNHETAQPALQRCGTCGGTGHNARTYKKDTEASSKSDPSTVYAGSLLNSDEIEE
jgi:hypothetical protein